jgi:hypothetical protein
VSICQFIRTERKEAVALYSSRVDVQLEKSARKLIKETKEDGKDWKNGDETENYTLTRSGIVGTVKLLGMAVQTLLPLRGSKRRVIFNRKHY